jgi:hypothetical protein
MFERALPEFDHYLAIYTFSVSILSSKSLGSGTNGSAVYISPPAVLSEHAVFIHLTFQVQNLISIFFSLGRLSKESVQVRGFL